MDIDPTLPEPVRRFLATGARLESIVLDAEGRWSHEGEPFVNERLDALFHRSIGRTEGGTWVLQIPPYTYPIEIADTPYHVRSLRMEGEGAMEQVILRLSDDTEEVLDPATLRERDGHLYCSVKGGAFSARCNRPAHHALLDRLAEEAADGRPQLRLALRLYAI